MSCTIYIISKLKKEHIMTIQEIEHRIKELENMITNFDIGNPREYVTEFDAYLNVKYDTIQMGKLHITPSELLQRWNYTEYISQLKDYVDEHRKSFISIHPTYLKYKIELRNLQAMLDDVELPICKYVYNRAYGVACPSCEHKTYVDSADDMFTTTHECGNCGANFNLAKNLPIN